MVSIYILRLLNNKFYVGKSMNPCKRIKEHFKNNGSVWTKKYKPIETIKIISDCDHYDEDKYTKIYMEKYGINNVRGGSFTSINLKKEEIIFIEKAIITANDRCFKCGSKGHFINNCPHKKEYRNIGKGIKFF